MRLDTTGVPADLQEQPVGVGDVYAVSGGRGGPRFQVVVAISGNTAYLVVFRADGDPSCVAQSGLHYLERKHRVGFVRDLPILQVEWL